MIAKSPSGWRLIGTAVGAGFAATLPVACISLPTPPPVEFRRTTDVQYLPTTSVSVYVGSEVDRAPKKFVEIGTVVAIWSGPRSTSMPLAGQAPPATRETDRPATPLPEIYRLKARQLGADALFVSSISAIPITTNSPSPTAGITHPRYGNLGAYDMRPSIQTTSIMYRATVSAVRFLP